MNRILPMQRKQIIIDYLSRRGSASVTTLSTLCEVSEMTIRRDLDVLGQEGLIQRTHGGALSLAPANGEPLFDSKNSYHEDLKERIAGHAVRRFVTNNSIIILEGGTTVSRMAHYLGYYSNLTVVTNGLRTTAALSGLLPASTVLCSGGMLREPSSTFVGPASEQFFRQLHADSVFLSATGLTLGEHFTDPNLLESQVKREMRAAGTRTIMLLDSTKFGQRSLLTTFRIDDIDALITDDGAPADFVHELRARGLEVMIAP